MTWTQFWTQLRAPLAELPLVGEAGPWLFLVAMSLIAEWATDRFIGPALFERGQEKLAAALVTQADGLRAGVLVAAFSGLTTMDKETAMLGLIVGAALPLFKLGRDQLMGAGALLIALLGSGCAEPRHPERDACYLAADAAAARAYADECGEYPDTRVCPSGDAIEERHAKDQEACP